jgi:hypothetical protein
MIDGSRLPPERTLLAHEAVPSAAIFDSSVLSGIKPSDCGA